MEASLRRRQAALHVNCCTCGGFEILVAVCREVEFDGEGVQLQHPLTFQLIDTDPKGCEEPEERMTIMRSSFADLYDDILHQLAGMDCELADEQLEKLQQEIQKVIEQSLQFDLQDLQHPN